MNTIKFSSAAAISLVCAMSGVANAGLPPPLSLHVCISAKKVITTAHALLENQGSEFVDQLLTADFTIANGGRTVQSVSLGRNPAPISDAGVFVPAGCLRDRPLGRNIAPDGTLPGADLVAVKAVADFRQSHPWPGPGRGAQIEDKNTAAYLATRGKYIIVAFVSSSKQLLGCDGSESYRVDPRTKEVLAFDFCVEGHHAVLPRLGELAD